MGKLSLLEASRLPKLLSDFDDHKTAFFALVDKFVDNLDQKISDAMFKRGAMANRADYPTKETLRGSFNMYMNILDVPTGDFRSAVAGDLADDLHKHYERNANDKFNEVLNHMGGELVEVMTSISRCCDVETVVDKNGDVKVRRKKLYDSTIEKALKYCDMFKKMNVTGNVELEDARANLEKLLTGVNISALKESVSLRGQVKDEVDSILSKFSGFKAI
jgi:hypothetical protein